MPEPAAELVSLSCLAGSKRGPAAARGDLHIAAKALLWTVVVHSISRAILHACGKISLMHCPPTAGAGAEVDLAEMQVAKDLLAGKALRIESRDAAAASPV